MKSTLTHPDASIQVVESNGKRAISVEPRAGLVVPQREWETNYPLELIEHVLRVKGPSHLCNEIMRDEYPLFVQHSFDWEVLSYVSPQDFAGKRLLDFGSGSGASSMVLGRMFPGAVIVGVELDRESVGLARHRAEFYGVSDRVRFLVSPDPSCLPADIGEFDSIVFSAVLEHLLPNERRIILPLLWPHLKQNGLFFINQTPYRWSLIEGHTTGLPLINYLPDRLALSYSRRFSKRVSSDSTWEELLRRGIRGGTTAEVLKILNQDGREAQVLNPSRLGVRDHIDLWYQFSRRLSRPMAKKCMMRGYRIMKAMTGVNMMPSVSLAICKRQ